jgi:hypothetical protein
MAATDQPGKGGPEQPGRKTEPTVLTLIEIARKAKTVDEFRELLHRAIEES